MKKTENILGIHTRWTRKDEEALENAFRPDVACKCCAPEKCPAGCVVRWGV